MRCNRFVWNSSVILYHSMINKSGHQWWHFANPFYLTYECVQIRCAVLNIALLKYCFVVIFSLLSLSLLLRPFMMCLYQFIGLIQCVAYHRWRILRANWIDCFEYVCKFSTLICISCGKKELFPPILTC